MKFEAPKYTETMMVNDIVREDSRHEHTREAIHQNHGKQS